MTKSFRSALLGAIALTLIIPAVGLAQTSDSENATASATIVAPITITKVADLDFGDIVADATAAGSVTLSTAGVAVPTTVQHLGGESAASVSVTGVVGQTFSVSAIPGINLTGPGTAMPATFTSNCGTCTIGTDGVAVGGTLTVNANQAAGSYSGVFTVTVSYN